MPNNYTSYKDFYERTIDANYNLSHNGEDNGGFKLVLGGTGLGKTYGLREAIKHYHQLPNKKLYKFIYITNRHNLITEQEFELEKAGINTTYQKSDKDLLIDLKNKYQGLNNIIQNLNHLGIFNFSKDANHYNSVQKNIKNIIKRIELYHHNLSSKSLSMELKELIENDLSKACNEFYSIIKNELSDIYYNQGKDKHSQIMMNEIIWDLFPYVRFLYDDECNVLLMTIHKALKGFFDGKVNVKSSALKQNIIFLDEFDFLESDILKIISEDTSIANPLDFVKIFKEKYAHLANQDIWDTTEDHKNIKGRLDVALEFINTNCEKFDIDLDKIKEFKLKEFIKNRQKSLFQTNEVILSSPIYLKEMDETMFILNEKIDGSKSPYQLFRLLAFSTKKIISAFNPITGNPKLVRGVIQEIWNPKNDNKAGEYHKYILDNLHYQKSQERANNVRALKDYSPYDIGYRYIKLLQPDDYINEHTIEIDQIELLSTPESIISTLSSSNLVFGLSATADIHRVVGAFNIEWIKNNTNYIPIDKDDLNMIKGLRDNKQRIRDSKINFSKVELLKSDDNLAQLLDNLGSHFYSTKSGEKADMRKKRLSKTLFTIKQCVISDDFAHLIFLTTFEQIKNFLHKIEEEAIDELTITSKKSGGKHVPYYEVSILNKQCHIILLNASKAKKLNTNRKALKEYKEAFECDSVIVITQYNSASNGVNLPCYDLEGNETDFRGLHLIETNHFWFDYSNEEKDFKNIEKQAMWRLWKLYSEFELSYSKFKSALALRDANTHRKPNIQAYNRMYKNTDDCLFASIALYHQAIGRIERKKEHIPSIDISMDKDVFSDFCNYLNLKGFEDKRKHRDKYLTSSLILAIQQEVLNHQQIELGQALFTPKENIAYNNKKSKKFISDYLELIGSVNRNQLSDEKAKLIKLGWEEIRQKILKHELNSQLQVPISKHPIPIAENLCFTTNLVSKEMEILISYEKLIIHKEDYHSSSLINWNLNYPYQKIKQNQIITQFFEKNGYALSFQAHPGKNNIYFTPYIFQAILQGAIGEKAIEALLTHHGVELEEITDIPNKLFEVIDAKVKHK
ncbi:MAG: hypothetical protein ACR2MS_06285, partial [Weeksellaceae bacterium]